MAQSFKRRGQLHFFLGLTLFSLVALGIQPIRAEDSKPSATGTSLKWIPQDAAFYSSMLRTREQLDIIAKSNAWARIMDLPAVQMGLQMAKQQMENNPQFAQFRKILETPDNQQLVAMLGDMASEEIFVYGGDSIMGFLELASAVNTAQTWGSLSFLTKNGNPGEINKAQVQGILNALAAKQDLLKLPELVIGFKIKDAKRAEAQLKRLKDLLEVVVAQIPPLEGKFEQKKVGTANLLVMSLDGKMVPWDQVPIKDYEDKEGQYDKLIAKLKEMKLTISLGVRDDYLLLAFGESTATVSKLGQGQLLIDHADMKPLKKAAGQRLTSVGYLSKALRAKFGTSQKDIDDLVKGSSELLKNVELSDKEKARIKKDAEELAKDLKSMITETGTLMGFSYLTERGQESFAYDYAGGSSLDGSKPLTLLNHVGGAPLCAIVSRSKFSPEPYNLMVKWIKVAHGYVEDFVVPRLDEGQREHYTQVAKIAIPLLKQLDETTSKLLLPSLADGQVALVIDAKLASKKWVKDMPPSSVPLPILEPAFVLGVSDPEQLAKAMSRYRAIANDAFAKIKQVKGEDAPDFTIPEPQTKKVGAGTLYFYPLPSDVPLDKQISPNAGLADKVAVVAISMAHSERLLKSSPLKVEGLLADTSKPLASAAFTNCAAIVDTIYPWVEYGAQTYVMLRNKEAGGGGDDNANAQVKEVLKQIKVVADVLKVFKTYTSISYFEDNALVTHGETIVEDLPKQGNPKQENP